jgi:peptide/nickel transport system substrate-binding protein
MTAHASANPGPREVTRRALLLRGLALGSTVFTLTARSSTAQQLGAEPATPTPPAAAVAEPRTGGTLRIGKPEDIVLAGVPHLFTPGNIPLYNLVYDTLVTYDQQLNPQPRLATSWVWSSDFRELTLQLRPGVTFHTGRPFTSADARFNLERLREPSAGSQWRNYANLMRVATPDPATLVIGFDAPCGAASTRSPSQSWPILKRSTRPRLAAHSWAPARSLSRTGCPATA